MENIASYKISAIRRRFGKPDYRFKKRDHENGEFELKLKFN
jgi:hypothetical protein